MSRRVHDEEDASDGDWISKLGLDDHSSMSFAAGLLRPPFIGAWQLLQVNYNCSVYVNGVNCIQF